MSVTVIGVDPGPIPGVVTLELVAGRLARVEVYQCSANACVSLVDHLLDDVLAAPEHGASGGSGRAHLQVEAFVAGRRASRSSTASAGAATRDLVGALRDLAAGHRAVPDGFWHPRAAGHVKPWATDARLDAAGLLAATKGMRHARDAARHALFSAVRDAGLPDPLSQNGAPAPA